ncbi:MAG: hypothetical protein PHS14_05330 [Elusimicrobia bacterium]|nr:hypothetical protein [Elusimicrobiota bacterium]
MIKRYRPAFLLLPLLANWAAAPLAFAEEAAAPKTAPAAAPFVRPEFGFSVIFPAPPVQETSKDAASETNFFRLTDDHLIYQVVVAIGKKNLDAPKEMKDAVEAVADSMKGRLFVTESVRHALKGGRNLPAMTFVAENDSKLITGKFIVDGKYLYGYAVAVDRGFDRHAAVEAFIRSFKLTPVAAK